ncbi:MAG: hypothetical protein ACRCTP_18250, partial [Aeromonas popoffii]|uniref:hypothetical protein n=1 Tax=Aeromonas popoffii TaxID=70856 RepID=UPI003F388619
FLSLSFVGFSSSVANLGVQLAISAIYRRGVGKGTNESRPTIVIFFCVRNWMCGVSACENREIRVSHGESVRVGSTESVRIKT